MKTLTKKELKLQGRIQGRHDGTIAKYVSSEELPPPVELTFDDLVVYGLDLTGWVAKAADWTLSKDEQRTAGDREQRAADAQFTSQGMDWWGASSPSGYGPTAIEPLGTAAVPEYDGTEVITTVDAVNPDDVRVDAGFVKADSWNVRYKVDGMYRDFVQAARVFAADDEQGDLWTDEGYDWERLSTDSELAVSGPSFTAYWE